MNTKNYSLEVHVNGRPVTEFHKDNKVFIEGREGTEYVLKFRNNSHKKVMGVFSVDGIDVLEGKEAVESTIGYIIDPFSSIDVKGFRIDDSSVAAFKFSDTEKSYSNTMGAAVENPITKETTYEKTTKNNGTIGVRVFEEDIKDNNYVSYYTEKHTGGRNRVIYSSNSFYAGPIMGTGTYFGGGYVASGCSAPLGGQQRVFTTGCNYNYVQPQTVRQDINQFGNLTDFNNIQIGASSSFSPITASLGLGNQLDSNAGGEYILPKNKIVDFDIGTALGNKLVDKIKEVQFNRSKTFTQLEIFYASRKALIEFGIDFSNTKKITQWPQAFEEKKKFCKMPAGY